MSSNGSIKKANNLINMRGRFLSEMVNWVCGPSSEITEEAERAIDKVLYDRKKRIQVFLTALAKKHVERIIYLIGKSPMIEDELFRKDRIETARTSDLIRLLAVAGGQVDSASEFLRNFVSPDELRSEPLASRRPVGRVEEAPVEEDTEKITEEEKKAALQLSPESRKRVMRVLRKVISVCDVVEETRELKEVETEPAEGE